MFHLFRFIALVLTLGCSLSAFGEQVNAKNRTIRILFLNAPADAPRKLFLYDGQTSQQVEMSHMNLSIPYNISTDSRDLILLKNAVDSSEEVPKKAPRVTLPQHMSDAYLICLSDPGNEVAPVKVYAVDATMDKFNLGQMAWFNLTPHSIVGKIGDQKIDLSPESKAIIDKPMAKHGSYPVILSYVMKGDPSVWPICQTRWQHNPKSRQLVFVFNEGNQRLPRIRGFEDIRVSSVRAPR